MAELHHGYPAPDQRCVLGVASFPGTFLAAGRGAREVPATDSGQRYDTCHERDDRRDQHDAVQAGGEGGPGDRSRVDRPDLGTWLSDRIQNFDAVVAYKADPLSRGEDTDWSRIETWAADYGKTPVIVDFATGIRSDANCIRCELATVAAALGAQAAVQGELVEPGRRRLVLPRSN